VVITLPGWLKTSNQSEAGRLEIYDITGRCLRDIPIEANQRDGHIILGREVMGEAGIYFIRASNSNRAETVKVMAVE